MRPLKELSLGPSPILSKQQVATLFGPIEQILSAQELFYSALTSRTLAWNMEQKIGDVFLSSVSCSCMVVSIIFVFPMLNDFILNSSSIIFPNHSLWKNNSTQQLINNLLSSAKLHVLRSYFSGDLFSRVFIFGYFSK